MVPLFFRCDLILSLKKALKADRIFYSAGSLKKRGVNMPLDVTVVKKGQGAFTISPTGSIDANTYAVLEKEVDSVLGTGPEMVIFDMAGVDYISSAGLRVIFKTKKALKQSQGKTYLVNLTAPVKKVFDIINALPQQEVFASVKELDDYLAKIQRGDNE